MKKKCIHEIKDECCSNTTFIILCARKSNNRGFKNIPLTSINSTERLIDYQIKTITSVHKQSDIILISGFEHDKLIDYIYTKKYDNIRILENQNYKNSDIVDAWKIGLNLAIKSNVYIIHGDRIFSKECINDKSKKTHLITHAIDYSNYNLGLVYNENDILLNISYGLPNVWSEIFYISKEDFTIARKLINTNKSNRIYTVDAFINLLSEHIEISIVKKDTKHIKALKDIQ